MVQTVACHGPLHGDIRLDRDHPSLVHRILPARFEQYRSFEDDNSAGVRLSNSPDLKVGETTDFGPDNVGEFLHRGGVSEYLAAECPAVELPVGPADIFPERRQHRAVRIGVRFIGAVAKRVRVDHVRAQGCEVAGGGRLPRSDTPG